MEIVMIAFNSLSRDHWLSGSSRSRSSSRMSTFNSLSRDHIAEGQRARLEKFSKLSTPSLGITVDILINSLISGQEVFNSLSRDHCESDSGIFRLSAAFCRGTSSHK